MALSTSSGSGSVHWPGLPLHAGASRLEGEPTRPTTTCDPQPSHVTPPFIQRQRPPPPYAFRLSLPPRRKTGAWAGEDISHKAARRTRRGTQAEKERNVQALLQKRLLRVLRVLRVKLLRSPSWPNRVLRMLICVHPTSAGNSPAPSPVPLRPCVPAPLR